MDVDVVVPWRGGCAHRERAWGWVRRRYHESGLRTITAAADPGPWVKASAIMPALRSSTAEVAVIADADVWTDGLERGIRALYCGMAEWAVPHRRVLRLSEASTEQLHETGEPGEKLDRRAYEGRLGGGVVIARREALLEVPMDRRFVGWGNEDEAWGVALEAMLGRCWRGNADLLHLWHPLDRASPVQRQGSPESWALYRRYARANGQPERMKELLREA